MTEQEELKQLADECYSEAIKLLHAQDHKAALTPALRAKDIYTEINNRRGQASIANLLSLIYQETGNAALELQFQLDALDIAIEENAYDLSAKLYNNLGSKLLFSRANERALFYFQNAIEMSKKAEAEKLFSGNDLSNFELVINMNIATVYCRMGDLEKAKYHHDITLEASKKAVSEDLMFPFIVFDGLYYKRVGQLDKAKEHLPIIMDYLEKNPYTTDYLEVLLDVLELIGDLGDTELWEKVLTMMDAHMSEDSSIYMRIELLNQWLIFYRATGNTEAYRDACTKYYELSTEKARQDTEREANSVEVNAEMHRAILYKKESESIIYLDPLTGIGNRNKMLADSAIMIEESAETRNPLTIGLLDIDFFKESNDTYGHIEGDHCLKAVAQIISDAVGDIGHVYRYGGDEFLILMNAESIDQIKEIAQNIRDNLAAAKLRNEKSPICPYVTISQGYTSARADKEDTIETLVPYADRVLYYVKRQGRDNYKYMTYSEIRTDLAN